MNKGEQARIQQRNWYEKNRDSVIAKVMAWQTQNHEQYIAYQRKNRADNLEKRREQSHQWKSNNAERHRASSRLYGQTHRDRISRQRKEQRRMLKASVLAAYGGVCACCSESIHEFLTIDHVNGDGASHRKSLGIGAGRSNKLYEILVTQGFPPGFRVLCFNCNSSLGFYGYCPHRPGDSAGVPPTRRRAAVKASGESL